MDPADDAEVMRASVTDPAAFEVLFDRYHTRIWAFLARSGGRDHADDLAGEVFVVGFRRRGDYDPARGSVRAWLYGIASNVSRTQRRSDRRGLMAYRRAFQGAPASSEWDAVDDSIVASERAKVVAKAFAELSPKERQVIGLYAWDELSYEEIAAVLEVPVGTVRSRLARARANLRELIEPFGEEAHDG